MAGKGIPIGKSAANAARRQLVNRGLQAGSRAGPLRHAGLIYEIIEMGREIGESVEVMQNADEIIRDVESQIANLQRNLRQTYDSTERTSIKAAIEKLKQFLRDLKRAQKLPSFLSPEVIRRGAGMLTGAAAAVATEVLLPGPLGLVAAGPAAYAGNEAGQAGAEAAMHRWLDDDDDTQVSQQEQQQTQRNQRPPRRIQIKRRDDNEPRCHDPKNFRDYRDFLQ